VDPDLLTPRSPPSSQVVDKWVARGRDFIVLDERPQGALSALTRCSQHPRPLAPGLPRRPCAAAYGLGPSVFTMRAKEVGHGSRLGFPGRRPPGDPAAFANVARDLQVLRNKASPVSSGGRGELGLDPAEPGLRPAGVPPPERSAGGGTIALTADRSPMTERTPWS